MSTSFLLCFRKYMFGAVVFMMIVLLVPHTTFAADTSAPVVGAVTPSTATETTMTTFSASYSDDVGVIDCAFWVNGMAFGSMTLGSSTTSGTATIEYMTATSGIITVMAMCSDLAGNSTPGAETTVIVSGSSSADTTAPTVGTVSPLTGTQYSYQTFSASYADVVGVTECTLYLDGSSQGAMMLSGGTGSTSGTASLWAAPPDNGSNRAWVGCSDAAGNTGTGTEVMVVAASPDTTAPSVGAITPTSATAGTAVTLSASYADDVSVSECTLYVGGVSQGAMALASGTATATYTFSTSGTASANATCVDASGNSASGAVTSITVAAASSTSSSDTTGPTIGAISPITATQNTVVTLSATVTDASGVFECRLYVNGSDQGAMTASSSTYSRSYTPASSGTFTAYASCGDAVGNLGEGTAVTVTVAAAEATTTDTVAPTVGAISPTSAVAGTETTLSASVEDSGGMGSCVLYVNSASIGAMTIADGYASRAYTFDDAGDAITNAYCTDAAGNATRGASTTVTITAASEETDEEIGAVDEADEGSLIKLACGSDSNAEDPCRAVYYFDGKRHAFPNEKVYFTWYDDFDDVAIVTDEYMASITLGVNVTYHPGSRMVKFMTVNTVYGVGEDGELRAIASEDVAESIWGSEWNTLIDDISDAFYGNYRFGDAIESASDFDPDAVKASVTDIAAIFDGA